MTSPSTARPPASPALTGFPLVSGGPTETGSVEDGSMVVGVDWSGPCTTCVGIGCVVSVGGSVIDAAV